MHVCFLRWYLIFIAFLRKMCRDVLFDVTNLFHAGRMDIATCSSELARPCRFWPQKLIAGRTSFKKTPYNARQVIFHPPPREVYFSNLGWTRDQFRDLCFRGKIGTSGTMAMARGFGPGQLLARPRSFGPILRPLLGV